jgi:hypothetical protein
MRVSYWIFATTLACLAACAPRLSTQAPNEKHPSGVTTGYATDAMIIYKGMPYSATKTVTRTTPAGSTTVIVSHVWRDAEGRERVDAVDLNADGTPPAKDASHTITVSDPVTKVGYSWHTGKNLTKQVLIIPAYTSKHLIEVWPETSVTAKLAALPDQPKPEIIKDATGNFEELPSTYMHGVYVTGQRITIVLPPGTYGETQRKRVTTEVWTAPDLHLTVLRIQNDSITGSSRQEYTEISRATPDRSLFEPPADYALVDVRPASNHETDSK